jgi:hypothetical protein
MIKGIGDELRVISSSIRSLGESDISSSEGGDGRLSLEAIRDEISRNYELEIENAESVEALRLEEAERVAARQRELEDTFARDQRRSEIDEQRRKEGRIKGFYRWLTRQELIYDMQDMTEEERKIEDKKKMIKEALISATAGVSIGAVADKVLPEDAMQRVHDVRQEYVKMYGDAKKFDALYADSLQKNRELNKKYPGLVSPFNLDDATEALELIAKSNVPEKMQKKFYEQAVIMKKVGIDFGEETGKTFLNSFGDSSTEVMERIGNVLSSQVIDDGYKDRILNDLSEFGVTLVGTTDKTSEAIKKSTENYLATRAALVDQTSGGQLLSDEDISSIQTLLAENANGNSNAAAMLSAYGLDPQSMANTIKNGDWSVAFESVMKGMSSFSEYSNNDEALEAMFGSAENARRIMQSVGAHYKEVEGFSQKSQDIIVKSREIVDGMTVAETRAGEIQKGLAVDSMKNWFSLNKIFEHTSLLMNQLGVDYKTVGGIVGGALGAGKGIIDTILLGKMAGLSYGAVLARVSGLGRAVGGFFTTIGTRALSCIPALVSFSASAWSTGVAVATALWPVLAVIGSIIAIIWSVNSIINTVKQDWELYVWFFNDIWDSMAQKVNDVTKMYQESFGLVGEYFSGLWDGICDYFSGVVDWLISKKDDLVSMITGVVDTIYSYIKPIIGMVEKGMEIVKKVKGYVGLGSDEQVNVSTQSPTQKSSNLGSYYNPILPTAVASGSTGSSMIDVSVDNRGVERGVNDTNKLLYNMNNLLERQDKRSRSEDLHKIDDFKKF